MNPILKYLLDKIVPAIVMGLIFGLVQLYVDVQYLKRDISQFKTEYYDILEQLNNQLQRSK